ncbi:hypothetical protein [Joostella sp. CR20]|uniref:hypothetical protein n=1 Tax=Joostella sp. CR20 TaxID=2804312 RepID=UPI00313E9848
MKVKQTFFGILAFLVFTAVSAQNNVTSTVLSEKTVVTGLKIKVNDFEKLKNFDWNEFKGMLQGRDLGQEITIEFEYENNSENDDLESEIENVAIKVTGKLSDIDELTERVKNSINTMDKMEDVNEKG